jgi:uncharacterized protein involved in exopolysaccharide biosynthesis
METTSKNPATVIIETTIPVEPRSSVRAESRSREDKITVLRLLWSRRAWIARVVLAGIVLSVVVALLIPKQYVSTARLMPPDSQSGGGLAMLASLSGQSAGGISALAGDLLGMKTSGALFISVIHSRTAEDHIVRQFDLKKVYGTRWEEGARKDLERNTAVAEDRKSGVLTLSVTDRDPQRAAAIARAYIDQLDSLVAQLNTSSAHRERVFLEERLNAIKGDLEAAEKDFSQFASKNGAIDISAQGRAMLQSAAGLQGEMIAAESELEGLRQIYSDNNVRVRSTEARIAELRSQLAKLGGKYDPGAPAATSPGRSDNDPADSYPTLRQLPILGVPYADKYRTLKVEEAVFETLTKQYELAKVQEAKEIPSVKVLDTPDIPEHKSFPPRTFIVVGGATLALAFSALWILGEQRWQRIDPGDPGMIFAQEVYGTVRESLPWRDSKHGSRNGHSGESSNGNGADPASH